jgi:hypothetical protein
MSEMSLSENENLEGIIERTKISGREITVERGIFPRTKKKAPLLRAVLV